MPLSRLDPRQVQRLMRMAQFSGFDPRNSGDALRDEVEFEAYYVSVSNDGIEHNLPREMPNAEA